MAGEINENNMPGKMRPRWKTILLWLFLLALAGIFGFIGLIIAPGLISAQYYLLTGWISFPLNTFPGITFNPGMAAVAIASLVILVFLAQNMFGWLYRSSNKETEKEEDMDRPWPLRWTMAGVALLFLMFIAGIASAAAFHQAVWILIGKDKIFESGWQTRYCSGIKSDLANLAIWQEAYFTDHNTYTEAVSEPELPGLRPSKESHLSIKIGKDSFVAEGWSDKCLDDDGKPIVFVWDNAKGGMQGQY